MPGPNDDDANIPDGTSPSPDVIINRTNVALARSHRLLQSWLKPATDADATSPEDTRIEDEELFNESAGVGSKVATDELDEFGLLRGKRVSNDKLLEQLMGKKGAAAKRKQDALKKQPNGIDQVNKPQAMTHQLKREGKRPAESDDEDEHGRAAAFKSRRPRHNSTELDQDAQQAEGGEEESQDTHATNESQMSPNKEGNTVQRPAETPGRKRKPTSYLDELLNKNSRKKNKSSKGRLAG